MEQPNGELVLLDVFGIVGGMGCRHWPLQYICLLDAWVWLGLGGCAVLVVVTALGSR